MKSKVLFSLFSVLCFLPAFCYATPSTLIWTPSTDIQPYGKIHLTVDNYTPVRSRDHNDNQLYVQQVYGPTFSLLSDKPEDNLLGKLWNPLAKIMAETGFDYKKGLGPTLDKWPVYFHFKAGVPEDAYFKYMPAFAVGAYDLGYKHNFTNNNVWYLRGAKTISAGKVNLGRFSVGYFNGNGRLLRDKNNERDNSGLMLAWDRTMCEISDKLWLSVDYQGTQSAYGALNYGLSWKFTKNISAILAYDVYNNPNLKNTVTFQLDVDF
ncbi:MAG: hypothetical protein Q7K98_02670 [Candidatus Omnitrophota bacterium]|nr:hypothetical protein [Candidatus Omnitrophota bacterium]